MVQNDKIIDLDSYIISGASVVGELEYEGPIGKCFDLHDETDYFGKNSWECAESEMLRMAFNLALKKAKLDEHDIDAIYAGDLMNQCTGSAYGLMDFDIPYFGLYGACSTASEGIMLAAMACDSKRSFFSRAVAATSSHNCSAERQYRFPVEYGGQRTPTSQWTVTGAGAFLISGKREKENAARIVSALPGKVVEMGIRDANNMGAAMAPAAESTIRRFFEQSKRPPDDYTVVSGDLGYEGSKILRELLLADGIDIRKNHYDCGVLIYSKDEQDTHSGGSGCGCSASVMASYFLPKIESGEIKHLLFIGTGAMMSPMLIQQGKAIPAIAHLVELSD